MTDCNMMTDYNMTTDYNLTTDLQGDGVKMDIFILSVTSPPAAASSSLAYARSPRKSVTPL